MKQNKWHNDIKSPFNKEDYYYVAHLVYDVVHICNDLLDLAIAEAHQSLWHINDSCTATIDPGLI